MKDWCNCVPTCRCEPPKQCEWIAVKDRLPECIYGKHRWLVMLDCDHKVHQAIAINFPYPCGEINIAYFWGNKWTLSSMQNLPEGSFVSHWSTLPALPK